MVDIAYAMGTGGGEGASGFTGFIPLILMFVIFYFLLIRPQQKKTKEHRQMVSNLKKGDRIVTSGGIFGTVKDVKADRVIVTIADNVKVEVAKSAINGIVAESE